MPTLGCCYEKKMKSNGNHYVESTPLLESKRHSDSSYHSNTCREQNDGSEECEDKVKMNQPRENDTYLTDLQTMMHLLKASIGIGILGLPRALMNAGILVGPLLLLTVAVATIHCMHLLIKCSKRLCIETEKSALSYGEVADECVKRVFPEYNTWGSTIVNFFLCITQFGACTAYVLFMAENLHDGMAELDAVHMKKNIYIPIILPFLLMFCLVKNLKSFNWMSWFANFLMVVVFVSIFVYLFDHLQDPSELDLFSSWGDLPLSFGSATYAFEAIPIILPLENKIKNSNHFPRVINVSMTIVTALYFSMAIFGYMTFQDKCKGSVTLNLPNTDYYSTVKFLVSVAIFCTYFIQIYVFFGIAEPIMFRWISHEKYHTLALVLLRITTISVTCGLAAVIPHVNDIVSLVGASGAAFLAFVFPTIFHWIVFSKEIGRIATIKNVFVIIFGVVGSISGTYASLRNIIEDK